MTWQELLAKRIVERRPPAKPELLELRALTARELSDAAAKGLSPEGRFEHAYTAARAYATLVIRAEGYRVTSGAGGHYHTFLALEVADPAEFTKISAYLDRCRTKRNAMSYFSASGASEAEAEEILRLVPEFAARVDAWLRNNHPGLVD